jgi:hypothetical protein
MIMYLQKSLNSNCTSQYYLCVCVCVCLNMSKLNLSHYTPRRRLGEGGGVAPTHSLPRH